MAGLRPVVELMTVNFSLLAFDQIINHAAAIPYMFNGQATVPMVVRMPGGGGHQLGPTHSHSFEAMFLQIPGLLVACPSTPADGKGAAEGLDPRRQPGDLHRARDPLRRPRRGARGRRPRDELRRGRGAARGHGRDHRRHPADGAHRPAGGEDARQRPRGRGRGDRPAHAAPARPRHDPRLGPQDQPPGDRRGGLAARRRRREHRRAGRRAGLRPPRRADPAGNRRRRADALLEAPRAVGDPARRARRQRGARDDSRERSDGRRTSSCPGSPTRWRRARCSSG